MSDEMNLMLYVAAYNDAASAKQDFESLKAAEGDDLEVEAAVVMSRDADGNVDVLEKGDGTVGAGAVMGGGVGLVVGLFAPPLLAATAIGAGIGALLGHFTKKHEEKELGVELDEYLPPNSSAVVVVIDDQYLDRVEKALDNSSKRINKAIDADDYDKLQKALAKSDDEIGDAVDS
ncbi:MAG TPA: DUF1269 domain-containing protein [Ilumatobacteraceae bacterium]|nr:DUF1269 domain-containing protein [Ilumatobacteraceae bacterium]